MLIRKSISSYRHLKLGNIKLAFTQVCQEEIFRDVYFAANSMYYVESGRAVIWADDKEVIVRRGQAILIKQHSKITIQKQKNQNGQDFKSVIFYLFPDFVTEFLKQSKMIQDQPYPQGSDIINLGNQQSLKDFCESLLPFFGNKQLSSTGLKEKTFEALHHLSQHNSKLLSFLSANSKPVKIDIYEFMINVSVYNYSVDELAKLTGRSLSTFKRDFQTIFETTPHQWLLHRKINYAEHLLRDGKMKASDIYFMLGFNELSHFSAAFKKIKGFSPSKLSV